MDKILFVNACPRPNSRTLELARHALGFIEGELEELCIFDEDIEALDKDSLSLRDELIGEKRFDHPMLRYARGFAAADVIVIAAPYWDLMFPAKLRSYLESVTVTGLSFYYNQQGVPTSLCRARKLVYITTAGGPIFANFGFDYVKTLANSLFGISDVRCIKAEGLDIWGADICAIMEKAKQEAEKILA